VRSGGAGCWPVLPAGGAALVVLRLGPPDEPPSRAARRGAAMPGAERALGELAAGAGSTRSSSSPPDMSGAVGSPRCATVPTCGTSPCGPRGDAPAARPAGPGTAGGLPGRVGTRERPDPHAARRPGSSSGSRAASPTRRIRLTAETGSPSRRLEIRIWRSGCDRRRPAGLGRWLPVRPGGSDWRRPCRRGPLTPPEPTAHGPRQRRLARRVRPLAGPGAIRRSPDQPDCTPTARPPQRGSAPNRPETHVATITSCR